MNKFIKSFFAVLISIIMLSSSVPVNVFAGTATLSCPSVVHPNEKVVVAFSGAPGGDSSVYVVLAPATAQENYDAVGKRFELVYLEGKTSGELTFTAPREHGEYKFFMFINRDTVHLATSGIMKVEQYKATVSVSPTNPTPGSKVTVKYSGIPTLLGSVYVVTMKDTSKSTATAISNERLDLVYLDTTKSSGSVVMTVPTTPGKYNFRVVINGDTIIIGTSNTVQVSPAKATLTVSPTKYKKKAKITVSFSNAPTDMGTLYIVMMKKSSASTAKAVSNERIELKYIKGKSGKVQFTAPNKAGSYNFRMFVNKGTVLKGTSTNIEVY